MERKDITKYILQTNTKQKQYYCKVRYYQRQQQSQRQQQQPPLHSRSNNDSPESIDYPPLNNFPPIQPSQISQRLPESPSPPNL